MTLIMGHPEMDILYWHKRNHELYSLDTEEVKIPT